MKAPSKIHTLVYHGSQIAKMQLGQEMQEVKLYNFNKLSMIDATQSNMLT
jgi:hypothetical protein